MIPIQAFIFGASAVGLILILALAGGLFGFLRQLALEGTPGQKVTVFVLGAVMAATALFFAAMLWPFLLLVLV